jgi:hypothetical protein
VLPYLDINCNGIRDLNEPKAAGLKLRINGGRIERNDKDTIIRIVGLEPYSNYFIELDKGSFDNVAWQLKNAAIRINVDPNNFKLLEVPVAVVGEVTGSVFLQTGDTLTAQGRMIVNIYNEEGELAARTLAEDDGYFSYLGLAPGIYTARIDAAQLKNLKMSSSPAYASFAIKEAKDGDVAAGLELIIKPIK